MCAVRRMRSPVPAATTRVRLASPAIEAPVRSSRPASSRNTNRMCEPASENSLLDAQKSDSPASPPWRSRYAASRKPSRGVSPGPRPSDPAANPSVSPAARQRAPALTGCRLGSAGRMIRSPPAASSATGSGVGDHPEQEQQRVRQRLAHLASRPAQVEDAAEEGRQRDEAEPDQVIVALLEPGQFEARQETARTAALAAAGCSHPGELRRRRRAPSRIRAPGVRARSLARSDARSLP